jgi:hypothetical protein
MTRHPVTFLLGPPRPAAPGEALPPPLATDPAWNGPTGLPPASNTRRPAHTTRPSDFPRSFIPGLPPRRSPNGPPNDQLDGRAWDLPVLAHEDSAHAQVLRPRGVHRTARANAAGSVAFRLVRRRRHPGTVISRLNSRPARTPVNASLRPSRAAPHDSGPPWIATPSM